MLSGVVPVLATPFAARGGVDSLALGRLGEFVMRRGATAVATLGLASEAFALTAQERRKVVATVRKAVGAGVDIVVGVDATSLVGAREQASRAVESGATALMVLPPYLVRTSPAGLLDYFGRLGAEFGAVVVQDAPAATGVEMSVELLLDLAALPGVVALKIESPDAVAKLEQVRAASGGATLFGGRNAVQLHDELLVGANGTMPACEFTGELSRLVGEHEVGQFNEARWQALLPLLVFGTRPRKGWAVHKFVLHRLELVPSVGVRFPAEKLTSAEVAELEAALTAWESADDV